MEWVESNYWRHIKHLVLYKKVQEDLKEIEKLKLTDYYITKDQARYHNKD